MHYRLKSQIISNISFDNSRTKTWKTNQANKRVWVRISRGFLPGRVSRNCFFIHQASTLRLLIKFIDFSFPSFTVSVLQLKDATRCLHPWSSFLIILSLISSELLTARLFIMFHVELRTFLLTSIYILRERNCTRTERKKKYKNPIRQLNSISYHPRFEA